MNNPSQIFIIIGILVIILVFVFISACTGVESQTKKSFKNTENTIALKDLTSHGYNEKLSGEAQGLHRGALK